MDNILLKECIESLENCEVLNVNETIEKFEFISEKVIFTFYGLIDKVENKALQISKLDDIISYCSKDEVCFLLWNDATLPSIKTKIEFVIEKIDDVLALSFDTWILVENKNILIEINHNEEINLVHYN